MCTIKLAEANSANECHRNKKELLSREVTLGLKASEGCCWHISWWKTERRWVGWSSLGVVRTNWD